MPDRSATLWRRCWPAALVFAAALALYVRTLCPTVFVEGAGENIICVWTLGVPHPPGFPLFCLLGKAFAVLIPIGGPAYRVNLFSGLVGAAASGGLYLLLSALGVRRWASAAAALTFAFSATFWRQATIAEVYTLSLVLIVAEVFLLVRWRAGLSGARPPRGRRSIPERRGRPAGEPGPPEAAPSHRPLLWFAFIFGLGLTVHYNHLLLLPAYLYFVLAHRRRVARDLRLLSAAVLIAAAGFSLHLYAPLRSLADPPIDWGNPESLGNWWRYLTAEQYRGRMFQLPLDDVLANLRGAVAELPREISWPGIGAALVGAVTLFRRDRRLFWTSGLIASLAVVWAANYDIPWEIGVYYLPAALMAAIWIAYGLSGLVERLAPHRRGGWTPALVLLLPVGVAWQSFRINDLSKQTFVSDNARDIIDDIDERSALLLPSTNPTFSLLYLTEVEGAAPHLQLYSRGEGGVSPVGEAVRPVRERESRPEPRLVGELLASGLPVYAVERQPAGILTGFAQVPWGSVYRLVPFGEREVWLKRMPDLLSRRHRFDFERQTFSYGAEHKLIACRYLLVRADFAWERGDIDLADKGYARALAVGGDLASVASQVGQRYADQGRSARAAEVYEQALTTLDDPVLHNRLGAVYGRENRLDEAERHFQRALELQPDMAEAHANLASVYGRRGQVDEAIAELETALRCDPNNLLALRNLGFAYASLGRSEDARDLLLRALEVNPAQDRVRERLSAIGDGS